MLKPPFAEFTYTIDHMMNPTTNHPQMDFVHGLEAVFWENADPKHSDYELLNLIINHYHESLLIYGGNHGQGAELLITCPDDIPILCDVISKSLAKNNFKYIFIDRQTEGVTFTLLICLDILDDYLSKHHSDIPTFLFTSTYNAHKLNSRYKCIKFVGMAGFMFNLGATHPHCDEFYHQARIYGNQLREKTFLNFNRLPKPSRVLTLAKLYEKNLVDHSLTSMVFCHDDCDDYYGNLVKTNLGKITYRANTYNTDYTGLKYNVSDYWFNDALTFKDFCVTTGDHSDYSPVKPRRMKEIGEHAEKIINQEIRDKSRDRENLVLDDDNVADNNPVWHTAREADLFDRTWFSLINETYTNLPFITTEIKDMVFFSEKTSKALAHKHPFILFGPPRALCELKTMGFQTFDNVFDESYDLIDDPLERLDAIIAEVERLCSWGDPEWQAARHKLLPRIEHNFHTLMFAKFKLFNTGAP